ncbi:unnamed protein product [Periconia digitata]|uniref:Prokaryotic-type class I peptide chain release factors domain-containing protein n=1 Tax=Periconia digitata TaxID=1303443 RepID=A0A9W4U7B9_9PLEO|nr:unnamed protein product [Periconia digitata]
MNTNPLSRLPLRIFNDAARRPPTYTWRATFSTTPSVSAKPLPPRRVIDDADIIENFLKGSGPGGQKINKTSSAVQLKHIPTGIVVKCQDTRSRTQNRKTARKLLGERIEELELGEQSRTAIKAKQKSKKKASADKKKRRKYRALQGEKTAEEEEEGEEGEEVGVDERDNGQIDARLAEPGEEAAKSIDGENRTKPV